MPGPACCVSAGTLTQRVGAEAGGRHIRGRAASRDPLHVPRPWAAVTTAFSHKRQPYIALWALPLCLLRAGAGPGRRMCCWWRRRCSLSPSSLLWTRQASAARNAATKRMKMDRGSRSGSRHHTLRGVLLGRLHSRGRLRPGPATPSRPAGLPSPSQAKPPLLLLGFPHPHNKTAAPPSGFPSPS